MELLPTIQHEFVGISISDTGITCSWIQPHNATTYTCAAYAHMPCQRNELAHLRIYNMPYIATAICSFLDTHNLQHARISFALDGTELAESVNLYPQACPPLETLLPQGIEDNIWGCMYAYPYKDTQHAIYQCSIARSVLFQYQLLSILIAAHLDTITTQALATLNLYRTLQGPNFRQSQLSLDAYTKEKTFNDLVPKDMLKQIIVCDSKVRAALDHADWHNVAANLGLYLCEKEEYEAS